MSTAESSTSGGAAESAGTGAESRLGQVVSGRYRIDKLLGEGGMGAVYLAEHMHMRKRVALKLLHPEMSQNAEALARFEREARAASRIEHPNVAAATDFGRTDDGAFFLVLEYVEGESLRSRLERGALPPTPALRVARQMASALASAHDAGIVHRDLKPENVMIVPREDEPDFVKVLDFGIAKEQSPELREGASNQPLTRLGTILGTPEYMAPEQALGEPVTPRSDLYALGVMLYEMLTGLHPFDAPDRMAVLSFHLVAPVPAMQDRAPAIDVPPAAEAITRKLLEKDAKARPESARALVAEIDVALAAIGAAPAPASSEARPAAMPSERGLPAWSQGDSLAHTSLGQPAISRAGEPSPGGALARTRTLIRSWPVQVRYGLAATPVVGFLIVLVAALGLRERAPEDASEHDANTPGTEAPSASASASTAAKARARAPDEALRAASRDIDALELLAQAFTDDPAVPRALAIAHHAQGHSERALRAVRRTLELAGSARAESAGPPRAASSAADPIDQDLVHVVVDIAVRGRGEDDDEAFAILEAPLGARGVDALVELSTLAAGPRAAATRTRARASLAKPDVRVHASAPAAVLLDFRAAKDCAKKRDLLGRARDDGDARLLSALRPLKSRSGCGFAGMRDCYPCLRDGTALEDAIASIERRAPPAASAEPARR
jgi:serine/threonine-protein kinase